MQIVALVVAATFLYHVFKLNHSEVEKVQGKSTEHKLSSSRRHDRKLIIPMTLCDFHKEKSTQGRKILLRKGLKKCYISTRYILYYGVEFFGNNIFTLLRYIYFIHRTIQNVNRLLINKVWTLCGQCSQPNIATGAQTTPVSTTDESGSSTSAMPTTGTVATTTKRQVCFFTFYCIGWLARGIVIQQWPHRVLWTLSTKNRQWVNEKIMLTQNITW
jgi:hypothetical protein